MEWHEGLCDLAQAIMTEKKLKRPRDVSQLAKMMVDIASGDGATVPIVTKPNRKHVGGKVGGKARAKALAPAIGVPSFPTKAGGGNCRLNVWFGAAAKAGASSACKLPVSRRQ